MTTQKTHWLQSPNKNYLGEWDLPEKDDLILTIKSAKWEPVEDPITKNKESKKVVRWIEDSIKPMICNQDNSQRIIKSTGKSYMEETIGMKIALRREVYKDKKTKEEMMVVRVNPKAVIIELPELTPTHKLWDAAKKAVKDGKLESVKAKYSISENNLKSLQS